MAKVTVFPVVEGAVERHNADPAAHPDIRALMGAVSRFNTGLGEEYLWAKYTSEMVEKKGAEVLKQGAFAGASFQYADSVRYENGQVVLNNPRSGTIPPVAGSGEKGYHKYIVCSRIVGSSQVVYVNSLSGTGSNLAYYYSPVSFVEEPADLLGYVNSPNAGAYPPSVPDGYMYLPFGKLGEKANIVMGSYIGTGSSTTINFPFVPSFVIIGPNQAPNANQPSGFNPLEQSSNSSYGPFIVPYGLDAYYAAGSNHTLSWSGATLTLSAESSTTTGRKYFYFAFG